MWFSKKKQSKPKNFGKRWTNDEVKILIDGLNNNASFKDISNTLGREESALRKKYEQINKKRRSGSWTPDETVRLISLWNQGYSLESIGYDLDRKRNSILGRLNSLPNYPNKIISLPEDLVGRKLDMNIKIGEKSFDVPSRSINKKHIQEIENHDYQEKIRDFALKGYEIEHISEQLDLDSEKVSKHMDALNIWDEYDLIMLKKAEDRYMSKPVLGKEKSFYNNLIITREEEEKKAVKYIKKLISSPEGTTIEFKQTFWRNIHTKERDFEVVHSSLKNINAFLNTRGGDLIIGVDDITRDVVGVEFDFFKDEEIYLRQVRDAINNSMEKIKFFIKMDLVTIEEMKVLHINVLPSDEPVKIIDKKYNNIKGYNPNHDLFYRREGDSAVQTRSLELVEYISKQFPDFKKQL